MNQDMQNANNLYTENMQERKRAFNRLESMRKKLDDIEYDEEMASYREKKYGRAQMHFE